MVYDLWPAFLSSLVDNLAEGLHKGKGKDCKSNLEYMTAKDGLLTFKYVDCNNFCKKKFDEDLSKRFKSTYQFCDGGINKFCLMLRKDVYPYEYMDDWERFNETLPVKEEFYSSLTMESITGADMLKEHGKTLDYRIKVNTMICMNRVIPYC